MHELDFEKQMVRLSTQWSNSYGPERKARLWATFKECSSELFAEMVDQALDTMRAAPLVEDFSRMEIEVAKRRAQGRVYDSFSRRGFGEVMHDAARDNKTADKEYVKRCIDWFGRYGKIPFADYLAGCDVLDKLANTINPKTRSSTKEYRQYKED